MSDKRTERVTNERRQPPAGSAPRLLLPSRRSTGAVAVHQDSSGTLLARLYEPEFVALRRERAGDQRIRLTMELRFGADAGECEAAAGDSATAGRDRAVAVHPLPWPPTKVGLWAVSSSPRVLAQGQTSGMGTQRCVLGTVIVAADTTLRVAAVLEASAVLERGCVRCDVARGAEAMAREWRAHADPAKPVLRVALEMVETLLARGDATLAYTGSFSLREVEELRECAKLECAVRVAQAALGASVSRLHEPLALLAPARHEPADDLEGFHWVPGAAARLRQLVVLDVRADDRAAAAQVTERSAAQASRDISIDVRAAWDTFFFVKLTGDTEPVGTVRAERRPPRFEGTASHGRSTIRWHGVPPRVRLGAVAAHRKHGELALPPWAITGTDHVEVPGLRPWSGLVTTPEEAPTPATLTIDDPAVARRPLAEAPSLDLRPGTADRLDLLVWGGPDPIELQAVIRRNGEPEQRVRLIEPAIDGKVRIKPATQD